MRVRINFIKFISIIFVIIILTQLAACGKSSKKPDEQRQSDKVPSELTRLENNIEMIIKTLGGPAVKEEKQGNQNTSSGQEKKETKEDQSGEKNKEKSQDKQEDKSQQEGQGGQKGQQQDQASGDQQPKQPQDPMEKIVPIINDLHYNWNNLLPIVVKAGAKNDLVDNFGNALNNLTETSIAKNNMNTLMAANKLYSYIPDLYSLFKTKNSPEIKRMRYYSRNVILESLTANWTQADSDIENLKSIWSLYKKTLSNEQQELVNKLDFSVYELEKVVKEKNQSLIDIKGRVVFLNIEALEKATGDESSGEGKSKNQSSGEQSGNQQPKEESGESSSVYSSIRHLLDTLHK